MTIFILPCHAEDDDTVTLGELLRDIFTSRAKNKTEPEDKPTSPKSDGNSTTDFFAWDTDSSKSKAEEKVFEGEQKQRNDTDELQLFSDADMEGYLTGAAFWSGKKSLSAKGGSQMDRDFARLANGGEAASEEGISMKLRFFDSVKTTELLPELSAGIDGFELKGSKLCAVEITKLDKHSKASGDAGGFMASWNVSDGKVTLTGASADGVIYSEEFPRITILTFDREQEFVELDSNIPNCEMILEPESGMSGFDIGLSWAQKHDSRTAEVKQEELTEIIRESNAEEGLQLAEAWSRGIKAENLIKKYNDGNESTIRRLKALSSIREMFGALASEGNIDAAIVLDALNKTVGKPPKK